MLATTRTAPAGVVLARGGSAAWALAVALGGTPAGRLAALPAMAVLVALVALAAAPVAAVFTAALAWACLLGFDENRYGVLSWHGGDGWRFGILAGVAVACSLVRTRTREHAAPPESSAVLRRVPSPRVPVE